MLTVMDEIAAARYEGGNLFVYLNIQVTVSKPLECQCFKPPVVLSLIVPM